MIVRTKDKNGYFNKQQHCNDDRGQWKIIFVPHNIVKFLQLAIPTKISRQKLRQHKYFSILPIEVELTPQYSPSCGTQNTLPHVEPSQRTFLQHIFFSTPSRSPLDLKSRSIDSDSVLKFFSQPFLPKPRGGNINTFQYSHLGRAHSIHT